MALPLFTLLVKRIELRWFPYYFLQARELANTCLSTLAERLHGKSPMQQTINTVHRCIGDWEAKGVARTIFEETNLAYVADRPDPLAAECITSCPVADFYADCFLRIVTEETALGNGAARKPTQECTVYGHRPRRHPARRNGTSVCIQARTCRVDVFESLRIRPLLRGRSHPSTTA